MRKTRKKGLAALLLAISLGVGGYGMCVQNVSASEDQMELPDELEAEEVTDALSGEASELAGDDEVVGEITDALSEKTMELPEKPEVIEKITDGFSAESSETSEDVIREEEEGFGSDVDIAGEEEQSESTGDKNEFSGEDAESALSSENEEARSCGTEENTVFWTLDADGTLKITGSGEMADWADVETVPWNQVRAEIKKIEIEEGVLSIGSYAFCGCENLEEFKIPDSVQHIGAYAFFNCQKLSTIDIG